MVLDDSLAVQGNNGLGSLADELADAWDEEGEGEGDMDDSRLGSQQMDGNHALPSEHTNHHQPGRQILDGGDDDDGSSTSHVGSWSNAGGHHGDGHLSGPKSGRKWSQHRSTHVQDDDTIGGRRQGGGDDGSCSDEEKEWDELSPGLEARLAEIETWAQRGLKSMDGSEEDDVVERVTEGLRDLGGQANLETATTKSAFPNLISFKIQRGEGGINQANYLYTTCQG